MTPVTFKLFAINGTWLWAPDGYQEEPVPVVGYTLAGIPIRQGWPTLTFTWSFMQQQHMTALLATYNPAAPQVTITYVDKAVGPETLRSATAMMHEPIVGARQLVYYNNIAVKFTRVTPVS